MIDLFDFWAMLRGYCTVACVWDRDSGRWVASCRNSGGCSVRGSVRLWWTIVNWPCMCVGAGCKRGVRWLFEGGVAYPGGGGWAVKVCPWVQAAVDGCPEKWTGLREPDILPFGTQARRLESLPLCRQRGGVPRRPLCHHRTTRLLPAVPAPETYVLQQCSDL